MKAYIPNPTFKWRSLDHGIETHIHSRKWYNSAVQNRTALSRKSPSKRAGKDPNRTPNQLYTTCKHSVWATEDVLLPRRMIYPLPHLPWGLSSWLEHRMDECSVARPAGTLATTTVFLEPQEFPGCNIHQVQSIESTRQQIDLNPFRYHHVTLGVQAIKANAATPEQGTTQHQIAPVPCSRSPSDGINSMSAMSGAFAASCESK